MIRLALATLVLAPTLLAHDLWIEPSTFHPAVGERITVALRVGTNLQGEPMPRVPPLIDRFVLGTQPVDGMPGSDPAGIARVADAGPQWIGYQSHAFPMTLEAKKFEEYLKEEGLERIIALRAKSTAPAKERFYRCAKSLLDVSGSAPVDRPLGFTLELVPRANPYALRAGDALPMSLTFRGKPIANVLVVAMHKNGSVRARTDAKGHVSLRIAHRGFWLVKAVHMEPAPPNAGVDWESWWASMTFDLR
jgi:uncharacterized GH25 family protein